MNGRETGNEAMPRRRVLVVDDDLLVLGATERILASFDVTTSSGVPDARNRLAEAWFDVVLCDVHLGRDNGIDMFVEMRAVAPEQAARFIFSSGKADDRAVRERLEETGVPYLTKPVAIATLREVVASVAEGARLRRTNSARWRVRSERPRV
jgi:DNA-binding NtrC family response regulator